MTNPEDLTYNYSDYYEGLATHTALLMAKYINDSQALLECYPNDQIKAREAEGWQLCHDENLLQAYLESNSEL